MTYSGEQRVTTSNNMTTSNDITTSNNMTAAKLLTTLGIFTLSGNPAGAAQADLEAWSSTLAIEEIAVTAQKRQENSQSVPIAVSAFAGDSLKRAQITRLDGLAQQVPSLNISGVYGTTRPSLFMRGIGLDGFNAIDGNSVSVSTDEVVIESRAGQLAQMYDLERVEVLRGPQGTLHGRNTTGGSISLFSRLPGEELEGNVDLTVGRFGRREFEGGVSIPLVDDTLSVRLAAQSIRSDGDIVNAFNGNRVEGDDRWAARAVFLYTPTDNQQWVLNINTAESDSDGGTFFQVGANPDGSDFFGYIESRDFFTLSNDQATFEELETIGVSLKGEVDLGWAQLTSVTGFHEVESAILEDSDGSPLNLLNVLTTDETEQISQEIRLNITTEGGTRWVAGVFYFEEDVAGKNDLFLDTTLLGDPTGPLSVVQSYGQESKSYAAFGQVDFPVNDTSTVTIGLRYTEDEKDFDQNVFIGGPFAFAVGDDISDQRWTGRLAYEMAPTDDLLLYTSLSRGYRASQPAGLALLSPGEFGVADAEVVDTLEAGMKSEWLNRQLQLNVAVFYNDFDSLQVVDFAPAGGLNTLFLRNAEANTYGAELDIKALVTDQWRVNLSASYLKSEYEKLSVADKLTGALQPVDGQELVNAPELSLSLSSEYEIRWESGVVIPRLEVAYKGDHSLKVSTEPDLFRQQAYTLVDASIIYRPTNQYWEIQLWARNIGDEEYVTELIDVRDLGFTEAKHGRRESYGLTARIEF